MTILFANNAGSTLSSAIAAIDTSIALTSGALMPNPSPGDYFMLTIEDRRTGQREVVQCTARSGNTLTVVRAQEGTTAQAFAAGTIVGNRVTRGTLEVLRDGGGGGGGVPSTGDMERATYDPDLDGKVVSAVTADAVPWTGVTGKPSTFTPSTHAHVASDVTDFSEAVDDRVAALLVAGTNVSLSYNDGTGALTINCTLSLGGVAPATAISFTPSGGLIATDVQAALVELDVEKAALAGAAFTGAVTMPSIAVYAAALGVDAVVSADAGQLAAFLIATRNAGNNRARWSVGKDATAESGSNVGSDLTIRRYDDTGAYIDAILSAARATGKITIPASASASARFAFGLGADPTSPVNGDIWLTTAAGLKWRTSGVTRIAASLDGATFTGKVTTVASASGTAGFRLPHGAAPSAPSDGDVWTDTSGAYARINGTTRTFAYLSGGTYTGPIITVASATGAAGLNVPHGAAPTSPNNGDIWSTTGGFFGRVNGATRQLDVHGGLELISAVTPGSVSVVEFTGLDAYRDIIIEFDGLSGSGTSTFAVQTSADNGGAYASTGYVGGVLDVGAAIGGVSNPTDRMAITKSPAGGAAYYGVIQLLNFNENARTVMTSQVWESAGQTIQWGVAQYGTARVENAFRINTMSGNIDAGRIRVYGRRS